LIPGEGEGVIMRQFMALTKALADANRVRMLLALRGRELCLCQIVELMTLAPSTASQHMTILRQSGLVEGRKEGRWMYYRWPGPDASPTVRQALQWAQDSLAGDPRLQRDLERLDEILKLDPQELCERQSPRRKACSQPRRRTGARRLPKP